MKWFKLILDVTTFILIAILLFVYTYKENEEILPDTKYPIAVTDWNKKYSKNEIYKRINQFAKNENVAIYKSTSNYTNKNVDKDIYVFNKSKATTKSSPDSCVKCYTMFLPFLLIKIDVFS
ncbi:membrane spanning protein [Staphylococcus aureus]|nr:membrane spanning protein [Staphylococcus aureus]CAC8507916.1 membrane spanning protein [Staphylococcus aureus]